MMKYLVLIFLMLLCGCSLFTPAVPAVVESMVLMAAERVAEEVGKELGDVPMECEFEIDQEHHKLLMLCEADLK